MTALRFLALVPAIAMATNTTGTGSTEEESSSVDPTSTAAATATTTAEVTTTLAATTTADADTAGGTTTKDTNAGTDVTTKDTNAGTDVTTKVSGGDENKGSDDKAGTTVEGQVDEFVESVTTHTMTVPIQSRLRSRNLASHITGFCGTDDGVTGYKGSAARTAACGTFVDEANGVDGVEVPIKKSECKSKTTKCEANAADAKKADLEDTYTIKQLVTKENTADKIKSTQKKANASAVANSAKLASKILASVKATDNAGQFANMETAADKISATVAVTKEPTKVDASGKAIGGGGSAASSAALTQVLGAVAGTFASALLF